MGLNRNCCVYRMPCLHPKYPNHPKDSVSHQDAFHSHACITSSSSDSDGPGAPEYSADPHHAPEGASHKNVVMYVSFNPSASPIRRPAPYTITNNVLCLRLFVALRIRSISCNDRTFGNFRRLLGRLRSVGITSEL